MCAYLEHHAAAAARGALATLQEAWLSGEYQGSARATGARQLAQRLLRLVRGAVSFFSIFVWAIRMTRVFCLQTTSATLVRSRLRDVDQALRAAATSGNAGGGTGIVTRHRVTGEVDISAAEAAADVDFSRVRALPAGAALVELMVSLFLFSDRLPILTFCFIQTARDAQEVRQSRQNQADNTGSTMSAFQLRNRDMHTFEARQQAWRGTSREYADAGGR